MRDIKYKGYTFKLSEEVREELYKRRRNFKSWNLYFKELLKCEKQIGTGIKKDWLH